MKEYSTPIKDKQVTFYLPRDLREELRKAAKASRLSVSAYIRELIFQAVQK